MWVRSILEELLDLVSGWQSGLSAEFDTAGRSGGVGETDHVLEPLLLGAGDGERAAESVAGGGRVHYAYFVGLDSMNLAVAVQDERAFVSQFQNDVPRAVGEEFAGDPFGIGELLCRDTVGSLAAGEEFGFALVWR